MLLLLGLERSGTSRGLLCLLSHQRSQSCQGLCFRILTQHMFQDEKGILAMSTLYSLESTICERKAEILGQLEGKPSWTKKLLLDEKLLCSKIRFVNLYYSFSYISDYTRKVSKR